MLGGFQIAHFPGMVRFLTSKLQTVGCDLQKFSYIPNPPVTFSIILLNLLPPISAKEWSWLSTLVDHIIQFLYKKAYIREYKYIVMQSCFLKSLNWFFVVLELISKFCFENGIQLSSKVWSTWEYDFETCVLGMS